MTTTFKVYCYRQTSFIVATRLSRIQNLICKWFKIKLEIKYNLEFEVTLRGTHPLQINDILDSGTNSTWLVTNIIEDKDFPKIIITNTSPIELPGDLYNLVLIGTSFREQVYKNLNTKM